MVVWTAATAKGVEESASEVCLDRCFSESGFQYDASKTEDENFKQYLDDVTRCNKDQCLKDKTVEEVQ